MCASAFDVDSQGRASRIRTPSSHLHILLPATCRIGSSYRATKMVSLPERMWVLYVSLTQGRHRGLSLSRLPWPLQLLIFCQPG